MKKPPVKRCAIYTRKSSEEGLDQSFNSLDAQREACEAYIQSQQHEGWQCSKEQLNDAGFSGGNMKRPALVKLIELIKQKVIDIIVVYKVDRLSRSLADFAKLVELFDQYDVSFVSVTQQFNTSTSMGRLTLNVLLSFAQFEREVTGERIRDKITASKKKGMWMGGNVPLGYDVKDRKLFINKKEAKTVQHIYNQYIALKSVRALKQYLDTSRYRTKHGKLFSRGALYNLIQNPLYIGQVRHKKNTYTGEHPPIIDLKVWRQVQSILHINRHDYETKRHVDAKSLLAGCLFDDRGNRMSPSHTKKGNKRYRYYVSQALIQHRDSEAGSIARIAAEEIEEAVLTTLTKLVNDTQTLLHIIGYEKPNLALIKSITTQVKNLFTQSKENANKTLLVQSIESAIIEKKSLSLNLHPVKLAELFGLDPIRHDEYKVREPIHWQLNSNGQTLVLKNHSHPKYNSTSALALKKSVIKAMEWNEGLMNSSIKSLREIEEKENLNGSYVRRTLRLAYLSPSTLKAILSESTHPEMNLQKLRTTISLDWVKRYSENM
tara:strand:- start:9746 stop:11386 length:1641 start_codon:yes stop_codon:yes gene_type:complete